MGVCCICEKKTGLRAGEVALSPKLIEYRICNDCSSAVGGLPAQNHFDYLEKRLPNIKDVVVRSFVESILYPDRNPPFDPEIKRARNQSIMITSGYDFEGYGIIKYGGFISGEYLYSPAAVLKISVAVFGFGTSSAPARDKFDAAKNSLLDELRSQAYDLGCNAIIGATISYSMLGDMIGVVMSGTAVTIQSKQSAAQEQDARMG